MIELKQRPNLPVKPNTEGAPTIKRDGHQFFRVENQRNRVIRDMLVKLVENEVKSYYVIARHDFGKTVGILAIGFSN